MFFLPAKNAKNQIEHKEGSDHDERNEECPVKDGAKSIVGLRRRRNSLLKWLIRCWAFSLPSRVSESSPPWWRTEGEEMLVVVMFTDIYDHYLEHSQHGQDDVIKWRDAVVRPFPFLQADRPVSSDKYK